MKRSRSIRSRSRANGVGPYHLHLAKEMKALKGLKRGSKKHKKALLAAHSAAAKAVESGAALPPSHKRSLSARNAHIQKRKGHKKTLRGGHGVKAFRALPVSERNKIRAGALASVPASMRPKSRKGGKSNKQAAEAMRLYRSGKAKTLGEAWAMVKGGKSAGKSAGASKPKSTGKKGAKSTGKPTSAPVRTAALSAKKDSKGRMQYRVGGRLVSKKKYDAAKKKGAVAAKPPSATKKSTRAKKNPNFGMVLDGVKQFGRDFVTVQSVGGAAVVGLAHGFVAPMVAEKLNEYLPQRVSLPVVGEVGASDFAFTATGLVAGALLGGLGYAMGRPNLGLGLGLLAAGSGVVIDTVGLVMAGRSSAGGDVAGFGALDNRGDVYGAIDADGNVYGDVAYGEIYDAVPGGPMVYGDVAYGDVAYAGVMAGPEMTYGNMCASEYADAMAGDAEYSGADFSAAEGQALMDGPASWMKRFGRAPKRAIGVRSAVSRHAGREGHRWGWLIKLVGMEKAKQIAALPPEKRLQVIDSLRKQAVSSLANLMASQAAGTTSVQTELTQAMAVEAKGNLLPAPQSMGLDLTGAAGAAGGAGGALSYGSVVYAGSGF